MRPVKRFFLALAALLITCAAHAQNVRITQKPKGLVHGDLLVPVSTTEPVTRVELLVNNVRYGEASGRSVVMPVKIGDYIRRLRIRVVGYDAQGNPAGDDEMVINDPRPPFRVRLQAPQRLPASGIVPISANVIKPESMAVTSVDFFIGEEQIATRNAAPYAVDLDAAKFPNAVYARVVAHTAGGEEANDVFFFGDRPRDQIDVTMQQLPLSVASGNTPLRIEQLALSDNGAPRKIEALVPAADQPLYVIMLIDYSESMLEELPVVKQAAREFAQKLLRPQDRIAVVGFNDHLFWLTPYTNDFNEVARVVDLVKPQSETHLYDSAIEMLYELQKQPGRHALVVLTDGVDQGSKFKLDHLVHYARYAGVPLYPIVKNKMLTRLMRFGVGYLEARRLEGIARDTGATYFIIRGERELPAVYARLAQELRQQYQLVFYSDSSGQDAWHALAITSSGGQSLRIPKGYFP